MQKILPRNNYDSGEILLNQDTPKIAQREVLKNLCKYTYVLVHRQYGKTHLAYKIAESKLLNKNYASPLVSITMPTKVQVNAVYLDRFLENLAPFNPTMRDSTLRFKRPDHGIGKVEFFGADRFSDSDRGRTTVFNIGDEYASLPEGFFQQNIIPFGDVHDAPSMMTGTTSQGPNHFKFEFEDAIRKRNAGDKDYYALKWTIEDSLQHGEVTQEWYDARKKLYDNDRYRHIWLGEYMLDWYAYMKPQIYGVEVSNAYRNGQVGYFPHLPHLPVDTFWDIGVNGTAVWFRQTHAGKHRYIKFIEDLEKVHFQSFIEKYILPLSNRLKFRMHIFPHDIENREFLSEHSRIEVARAKLPGECHTFFKTRTSKVDDLIDHARRNFGRCRFDEEECKRGIENLAKYVRGNNGKPVKTGEEGKASHGADAFTLSENCTDYFGLDKPSNDPFYEFRKGVSWKSKINKQWWS